MGVPVLSFNVAARQIQRVVDFRQNILLDVAGRKEEKLGNVLIQKNFIFPLLDYIHYGRTFNYSTILFLLSVGPV